MMKEYTKEEKIEFAEYVIAMIHKVPNDYELGRIIRYNGLELNGKNITDSVKNNSDVELKLYLNYLSDNLNIILERIDSLEAITGVTKFKRIRESFNNRFGL